MNLPLFNALVPALLHTLWIGLVVAALLFLVLRHLSGQNARLRYGLGIVALLAVFLGGLIMLELPDATSEAAPEVLGQEYQPGVPAVSPQIRPVESFSMPAPKTDGVKLQTAGSPNWRLWLGVVWIVGAGISLLRLMRISLGIQQLVRQSRGVENTVVLRVTAELSRIAGTSGRILLLTGEHILQPAVVGIFRPAIFLPVSMLTGLPEWQLRAILAHELAHIVRHDFLVNALQLLAETILFFNPAVWWINRRIREEREACCDAMAAKWIDSSHELAETLIEQATFENSALPAFGNSNTVKDRILRLIDPARQPQLKLPWKSLISVILIALAGLILAQQGTSRMVGYLKRLHTLETARQEYQTPTQEIIRADVHGLKNCMLEFTLKTDDGSSISLPAYVNYSNARSSSGGYLREKEIVQHVAPGHLVFHHKPITEITRAENVWVKANGFAPVSGKGAAANEDGIIKLPPLVLHRGYKGIIQFIDPEGRSVSGVKLETVFDRDMGSGHGRNLEEPYSDRNGFFSLAHCGELPVSILIHPPNGFAREERFFNFKPNQTNQWVLTTAPDFSGTVVDTQNNPIPNATIYLIDAGWEPLKNLAGNEVTETGPDGHFRFAAMKKDGKYTLGIDASGHLGLLIPCATLEHSGQTHVLKPRETDLVVRLQNLQLLDRFYFVAQHRFKEGTHSSSPWLPDEWVEKISRTKTNATYRLKNLWDLEYRFQIGEVTHKLKVAEAGDTLVLDINELMNQSKRPLDRTPVPVALTLRLQTPDDEPMPGGTVKLKYIEGYIGKTTEVAIPRDGIISTNLLVNPGRWIEVLPGRLKGYSISECFPEPLPEIDVDCMLTPAGGTVLTVMDEEGNPVTHYHVNVDKKSSWKKGSHSYSSQSCTQQLLPDQTEKPTCFIEPLDFKSKYKIRVYKHFPEDEGGFHQYESGWFSLSRFRPVKKIKCVLKPAE